MADKNVILKDSENNNLFPQIADKSVTTNKLADKSVTKEKLADDINAASMVNTTWYGLKKLRDGKKFVPGMQYRITDYKCTTTQKDTQSAGHQFDIVVTADSKDTLNEVARAAKHEGDTYFANCNLAAWKVWYSLDNDKDRFAWANNTASIIKVTSGSATYYFYKTEETCKLKYQVQEMDSNHSLVLKDTESNAEIYRSYNLNDENIYINSKDFSDSNVVLDKDSDSLYKAGLNSDNTFNIAHNVGTVSSGTKKELLTAYPNAVVYENGHGVIYRMIDEWNNDCPYDFKNIQMKDNKSNYVYTFNNNNLSDTHDITVSNNLNDFDNDVCEGNIVIGCTEGSFGSGGSDSIIPFVFFTTGSYYNYISGNVHHILFSEYISNKFVFTSGKSNNLLNVSSYSDRNKRFIGLDADGNIRGTAIPKEVDLSAVKTAIQAIYSQLTIFNDTKLNKSDFEQRMNEVPKLVSTTDSGYAALATKDSNTLYCIPEK